MAHDKDKVMHYNLTKSIWDRPAKAPVTEVAYYRPAQSQRYEDKSNVLSHPRHRGEKVKAKSIWT